MDKAKAVKKGGAKCSTLDPKKPYSLI